MAYLDKNIPSFIYLSSTASADTTFKLAITDLWLSFADIFIITNSAYMGTRQDQTTPIYAGDVYSIIVPVNVNDLFFKNLTSGSNTTVIITGVTLTQKKADEYGITLPP
jgi:hypothetical protein